jgi:hypothetical protein
VCVRDRILVVGSLVGRFTGLLGGRPGGSLRGSGRKTEADGSILRRRSGLGAVGFPCGEVEDRRELIDGCDECDVDPREESGKRLDGFPGLYSLRAVRRLDAFYRQIELLLNQTELLLEPNDDHRARLADARWGRIGSGRVRSG